MSDREPGNGSPALPPLLEQRAPLPRPNYRRSRWPSLFIWIVPLLVGVGAGFYCYRIFQLHGPEVSITFSDTTGIRTGETPVEVHGVRVGTVEQVDLSPDETHAVVHVRFYRTTLELARQNTVFWLVRPDLEGGNINGLSTIISGPYIEALPGQGPPQRDFQGLDSPPIMVGDGIRVILHATRLEHLQIDSPVYYRGIQVGVVQDVRLSDDATQVNLTLFIWRQYQRLLRTNSQFWPEHSTEVTGGLFGGVHVQLGSLRTALAGGLDFATPPGGNGEPVRQGYDFYLNETPKPEWLHWAPRIAWSEGTDPAEEPGRDLRQQQGGLRSTIRVR